MTPLLEKELYLDTLMQTGVGVWIPVDPPLVMYSRYSVELWPGSLEDNQPQPYLQWKQNTWPLPQRVDKLHGFNNYLMTSDFDKKILQLSIMTIKPRYYSARIQYIMIEQNISISSITIFEMILRMVKSTSTTFPLPKT